MSQENVEIMRRWIAFSNARDLESIADLLDPGIQCFPAENEPEGSAGFRGRDTYLKRAENELDAFDSKAIEVSEYVDLGDYVAVVARIVARGRRSQAEVSDDEVWLVRFRDGRAVEYRECRTRARAVALATR